MRKWLSKLFALLLTLVILLGITPTLAFGAGAEANGKNDEPIHVYTEEEHALLENGVFARIQTVKDTAATRKAGAMTEADYVALIPQIVRAVENSDTFVPGSLQRNGNFLVWQTTVGIPCCYDPRMEAELHNTENDPTPEEIALAEARADALRQELSELQGGWPSTDKIGLIQPYWESTSNYEDSSFNGYSPSYKAAWEAFCDATGGQGMRYTMYNATVDNIASVMSQCGLVLFDSHGTTDYNGSGGDYVSRANSSYLCLITNAGVTSQDTQAQTGPYGTYYNCIKGSGYAYVNGTCIGNHMATDAPNSFLYMGICLGMATDGMEAGLRAKGVEAVWGYSQSVSFVGDEKYMKSLMSYLKEGDELGDAAGKVKAQYGNWDPAYSSYSYSQAVADYVAFPIVASDEDPYPGHGNVDVVQTVHSTWTLFAQHEITAVSNNDAWGTVSLSGRTITATPATGYFIAGYEVTSGTATVIQNGDGFGSTFKVNAESDCTVQIKFAARTPAQVRFSVPEGVTCDTISGYIDDVITLPSPQGAPVNNAIDFHFLGWATEPLDGETSEAPEFIPAGTEMELTETNVTFYALYGYFTDGEGAEGQFLKLSAAPEDWTGEYLITYNGVKLLKATVPEGSSASYMGTSKAVTAIADTPIISIDYYLSLVPDELVFVIAPDATGSYPGTYTVKMKGEDQYLAITSNSNSLTTKTAANDGATHWRLSVVNGSPVMTNVGFPGRTLQFNHTAGVFRGYLADAYQPITLYSAQEGSLWFTTDPDAVATCEEHVFGDWFVETEPTCTKPGVRCRVCEQCGLKEREEIPALGHNYVDGVCTRCGAVEPTTELTITNVASSGKNKLTWTAMDGAVSYNVYRAFSADGAFSLLKNTTNLTYTHTGGKPGKTYYYKVSAVYADREGYPCEALGHACDLARPVVTAGHVAATGKNKLSWAAVDGAVKYKVYCAASEDGEYALLATTTSLSYTHTAGVAGTRYCYKVMAIAQNTDANSAYSTVKSLVCDLARPEVSITLSGGGNPKLTWAAVDGAVKYKVYRATSADGTFTLCTTTTKLSFINTSVEAGKTYYYKVMAVAENSKANSAYSTVVSIKAGK